jgi:hypothetical protein
MKKRLDSDHGIFAALAITDPLAMVDSGGKRG